MQVSYERPFIYPYQKAIIDTQARFTITEASTKVGKTTSCYIWLHERALMGKANHKYWWVAPVYSQAKIAFTRLINALRGCEYKVNLSELTITIINGAVIEFKSADKPNNLYGEDVYAVVVDEFTRMKEESWFAIRSTISATNGMCQFIGNVRGRGWGYKLAQKAKNDISGQWKYNCITALVASEGGLVTKDGRPFSDEVAEAKKDLPIDIFNELYLCIPTDTGSNPFGIKSIEYCIKPMSNNPSVCYGIDLAKSVDYTAIIGMDNNKNVSYLDRFQSDWGNTMERIKRLPRLPMLIDASGVGDPIVEQLINQGYPVQGFKFTSQSKQQLMVGLQNSIQTKDIGFPEGVIVDELNAYEYEYSNSGVKYSAPAGMHDDCVCALALCNKIFAKKGNGNYNVMSV